MAHGDKIRKIDSDLIKFLSKEYENYKYGNVVETAGEMLNNLYKIKELINQSKNISENAGTFMSPALNSTFKKDLQKLISNL